ncbi:MAG: hypothetical protein SGJ07_07360 [Rhodospirillaceae bacterium]|nr:hypothetical protein [Rhodospirillaceae bacterium]
MIISLDTGRGPRLDDPDNFRAFKVTAPAGMDRDALGRALGAVGRLHEDGSEHAWIAEAALRKLAGRADDKAWNDQATGMIDYARRSGWIDAATGAIRAHIERV